MLGLCVFVLSSVASFFGMLPATIMEVYFGTAVKDVADIIRGNLENSLLSRILFWYEQTGSDGERAVIPLGSAGC